eukprot:EG_transcript_27514
MPKEYFKGRDHKERTQPKARKRHGFLEKHKDYVKRAKDHHKKVDAIKKLKLQAALRNPDEFAFGMHSVKTDEHGVHIRVKEGPTEVEQRASNRANRGYLQMAMAMDKKNVERLQASLADLDNGGARNRHVLFADDAQEAKQLQAKAWRPIGVQTEGGLIQKKKKAVEKQYKMLEARKERCKHLGKLLDHLEYERKTLIPGPKKVMKKTVRFPARRQR